VILLYSVREGGQMWPPQRLPHMATQVKVVLKSLIFAILAMKFILKELKYVRIWFKDVFLFDLGLLRCFVGELWNIGYILS
jgi:hypothetical protein